MNYIKLTDRKFYALFFAIVLAAFIFIYNVYPNFRSPIEASGDTDYPVLLSAIFALIMAALTLLVSWLIKTEAEGIGDAIISNTVIHRHLNRMLHEYTLIVLKNADDTKANSADLDNRFFVVSASCDSSEWFIRVYNSEYNGEFFDNLMPGKSGEAFSKIINFKNLSLHLRKNLLSEDVIQEIHHNIHKIKAAYNFENEERRLFNKYYIDPGISENLYNLLANDANDDCDYDEYLDSPQESEDFNPYQSDRMKQQKIAEDAEQKYLNLSNKIASLPEESNRASVNRENLFKFDTECADNKSAIEERILYTKRRIKEFSTMREANSNPENTESLTKIIDQFEKYVRDLEWHLGNFNRYLEAKEIALKEDSQINSSGAAIYAMMKALGWKLPLEFREIEKVLADSYQPYLDNIPKAA